MSRLVFAALALGLALGAAAQTRHVEKLRRQPFDHFETRDRFGRTIDFYLSEGRSAAAPKPLVVFVQGSGAGPLFTRRDGRLLGGLQNLLRDHAVGRAHVLCVEKPGVRPHEPFEQPGSARGASEEFRREHVLGRWAEAIRAAIEAAREMHGIDPARTLVVGHSEGGLVACRVAVLDPAVTHVASLAGGGVTQLHDLIELARAGHFYAHASEDPEARVDALLREWARVQAAPHDADALFLGHPHRRWSSFLASSPLEELGRTRAKVLLVQGTADVATSTAAVDALHAELLVAGRDVTYLRREGEDHAFHRPGTEDTPAAGFARVFAAALDWFAEP